MVESKFVYICEENAVSRSSSRSRSLALSDSANTVADYLET